MYLTLQTVTFVYLYKNVLQKLQSLLEHATGGAAATKGSKEIPVFSLSSYLHIIYNMCRIIVLLGIVSLRYYRHNNIFSSLFLQCAEIELTWPLKIIICLKFQHSSHCPEKKGFAFGIYIYQFFTSGKMMEICII